MAEWIKVEHTTPDKPEIVALAETLNIDFDAAFGKCMRFWIWADQHTADGCAINVTPSFIDRLTNCPGFARGLLEIGWLSSRNGRYSIPNFDRHNGQSAKKRALSRDRMKQSRNKSATKAQQKRNQKEKEKEKKKPSGKPGKPNPVWDAICQTWGMNPVTSSEKSRIGKLARDMGLKLDGSDPADIHRRRQVHERMWPNATATPESILKHWDMLTDANLTKSNGNNDDMHGCVKTGPIDPDDPRLEGL